MPLSRREFALTVAASSTFSLMPLASAIPADDPAQPKPPEKPDTLRTEAALLLELIQTRYPNPHLTPEVLSLIAGDVLGDIVQTRRISAFPLKNSDAPAFTAAAWRKPERTSEQ